MSMTYSPFRWVSFKQCILILYQERMDLMRIFNFTYSTCPRYKYMTIGHLCNRHCAHRQTVTQLSRVLIIFSVTPDADGQIRTLYDPAFEHDACGVGFVADLQGRAGKHILPLALSALARMAHRGAVDA